MAVGRSWVVAFLMTQTKRTRLISFHPRPSFILFHFTSNAKHHAGKGFFGHEIFLVDLNQVFFSVFPFLNGKCIKRKRNK